MMNGTVFLKHYDLPAPSAQEILRYAGCRKPNEAESALLQSCLNELGAGEAGRVCYAELPLKIAGDEVTLGTLTVRSQKLARHLKECESAVIFAATAGLTLDRLIARYSATVPSRGLMFQAIGAERIEALCNVFCGEWPHAVTRFSPGYGDLPLAFQRDIFRLLDCPRHIGLSLNQSLLMSPTKSVTAVVGLKRREL